MNAQPENINRFQNHSIENNDCELYSSNNFNQNPRVNERPINDDRQCLSVSVFVDRHFPICYLFVASEPDERLCCNV